MVLEKYASVLGERIEGAAQGRPGFAIQRMRMGRRDHVGARFVDTRMNRKRGGVIGVLAFQHFAGVINHDQIRDANLAKVHAERIHPKTFFVLGVAHGDVTGDAFVETKFREQTKSRREAFFHMAALLLDRGEGRHLVHGAVYVEFVHEFLLSLRN